MKATNFPPEVIAPLTGFSRFALYTLESMPILLMRKALRASQTPNPPPPSDHRKRSLIEVKKLLREEVENLKNGLYPQALIFPEAPIKHLQRYRHLLIDSINSTLRAKEREHKAFSREVKQSVEDLPEYYRRNFHFQTDGYLSESSAELYGHQTEILFAGTLDLMRRVLLAPLLEYVKSQEREVRILEFGCGAGESTRVILESCPNVVMTSVDLSEAYLDKAKAQLGHFKNVEFKKMAAEEFNDDKPYDVVFSAFMLHELPQTERHQILENGLRHLKSGGLFLHIDSLQMGDEPQFDWALIQFPKDFHEPFFTNYVKNHLEVTFKELGVQEFETKKAFLAKAVLGKK